MSKKNNEQTGFMIGFRENDLNEKILDSISRNNFAVVVASCNKANPNFLEEICKIKEMVDTDINNLEYFESVTNIGSYNVSLFIKKKSSRKENKNVL